MKTLGLIILGILISGIFAFNVQQKFQFAEVVKIEGVQGIEGLVSCTGVVKNYLGFNYYQLDRVWCDWKKKDSLGGAMHPSMIVSDSRMKRIVLEIGCTGYDHCYTPALGDLENTTGRVFYEDKGQRILFK